MRIDAEATADATHLAAPRLGKSGTVLRPQSLRSGAWSGGLVGSTLSATLPAGGDLSLRVERWIAEGGIGTVYAGRTIVGGCPVALKVLQAEHSSDAGLAERFDREIRFGLRLNHPNVARALGSGELPDGRRFLVMDLLVGSTLGDVVRSTGPLAVGRGLKLADQILAGLASIHAARIVHRDLQPDNVFVTPDAHGGDRVTILDFGFAQEPGPDVRRAGSECGPTSVVGTPSFVSPEQAAPGRAITERSDLFAVAAVLYYAFCGKLPFRGRDDLDVLVSVLRAPPVPIRRERRDLPRSLEAVLTRALAKHPDARFSGADEMREALRAIA